MTLHRSMFVIALFSIAISFGEVAAAADDIKTSSEMDNGVPAYTAEGIVDAPPAAVWALVSKCGDYVNVLPNVVASKELSREGDEHSTFTTVCEVSVDVPFPFGDLTSVSKATLTADAENGGFTRTWTLIRGDYEVNEGSWRLVAADGGAKTKVTYRIRVRPKLALPDSVIASSQKRSLPQVIQNLRDRTAKPGPKS